MALTLTRDNVLARFGGGGFRSAGSSMIRSASSMLKHELNPAVRTGAIALSAFGFGVIQGKYQKQGGLVLAGVPVDLLAGATFHVVALFGFARNYAPLMHALGDGALATFLSTTGYSVGQRWSKGASFVSAVHGAVMGSEDKPVSGGSSLADAELKNLVRGE
jgi:hypothetical protein